MVHFKRSVFVPPVDVIEFRFSDMKNVWFGSVRFATHNLSRVKPTRDDTWNEPTFLEKLQTAIQFPSKYACDYIMSSKVDQLQLEIRDKKKDALSKVVSYSTPILLDKLPASNFQPFIEHVKSIRLEQFIRYCRTGKLNDSKHIFGQGLVSVDDSLPNGDADGSLGCGWNALQCAAYHGKIRGA